MGGPTGGPGVNVVIGQESPNHARTTSPGGLTYSDPVPKNQPDDFKWVIGMSLIQGVVRPAAQ